jgi:hypothetical protein
MRTETILIVGAIAAAFAAFALMLWRTERLTRDLKPRVEGPPAERARI